MLIRQHTIRKLSSFSTERERERECSLLSGSMRCWSTVARSANVEAKARAEQKEKWSTVTGELGMLHNLVCARACVNHWKTDRNKPDAYVKWWKIWLPTQKKSYFSRIRFAHQIDATWERQPNAIRLTWDGWPDKSGLFISYQFD